MAEPYLGEIRIFGGNFNPSGWALCNGQLLSIADNTALFALLGTTYGGNGTTTFALPDMRSRLPIHMGQGPGLSPYVIGQIGGEENVTVLTSQLPQHNHALQASILPVANSAPAGAMLGQLTSGQLYDTPPGAPDVQLNPQSLAIGGGSQPHPNIQPYLCLNFIIALQGIFPSRN